MTARFEVAFTARTIKISLHIRYTLYSPQQNNVNYTGKFTQEIFPEAETHISPLSQVWCITSNNAFTTILLKTTFLIQAFNFLLLVIHSCRNTCYF